MGLQLMQQTLPRCYIIRMDYKDLVIPSCPDGVTLLPRISHLVTRALEDPNQPYMGL